VRIAIAAIVSAARMKGFFQNTELLPEAMTDSAVATPLPSPFAGDPGADCVGHGVIRTFSFSVGVGTGVAVGAGVPGESGAGKYFYGDE